MSFCPDDYLRERYLGGTPRSRMLSLYYATKPLLPRSIQIRLRRTYARRQARVRFPAWPIEPLLIEHRDAALRAQLAASGCERLPLVGYWPGGKHFACVLTHDVEGESGVRNVPRVLALERRHGFVSSWNFVAEWYPIESALFEQIRAAGGEIGLHAIKHDGRLFASRAAFEADLPKIHRYMRDWGAVGFRSPATHRNADWMPELDCLYDSSFPDTDPFEPQPGGCCSIHPFFLDDLVELPITLAQDHTLFEILRQHSIDLWTRKSDWIIRNHGLINLITHPDYLDTPARLRMYEEFLVYLKSQHGGWHALPRDVARWWRMRANLRVKEEDASVRVDGPGAEHASVTWARECGGEVKLEVERPAKSPKMTQVSGQQRG
jgi:peptidoglycan/xylan/chitin deacetylase (PgdA/CDA1 family)